MKEGIIKLNENEASALIELLNIAVKAAGLQAAEAALVITKKVEAAFKDEDLKAEPTSPIVVDIQELEK